MAINKLQMVSAMGTLATVVRNTAAAITSLRARINTVTKAVTIRALRVATQVAAAASKFLSIRGAFTILLTVLLFLLKGSAFFQQ